MTKSQSETCLPQRRPLSLAHTHLRLEKDTTMALVTARRTLPELKAPQFMPGPDAVDDPFATGLVPSRNDVMLQPVAKNIATAVQDDRRLVDEEVNRCGVKE